MEDGEPPPGEQGFYRLDTGPKKRTTNPPKLTTMAARCPCGLPLHYESLDDLATIEAGIARGGGTVLVTAPAGAWRVPLHYMALHGLPGELDLPLLAVALHFERAFRL